MPPVLSVGSSPPVEEEGAWVFWPSSTTPCLVWSVSLLVSPVLALSWPLILTTNFPLESIVTLGFCVGILSAKALPSSLNKSEPRIFLSNPLSVLLLVTS